MSVLTNHILEVWEEADVIIIRIPVMARLYAKCRICKSKFHLINSCLGKYDIWLHGHNGETTFFK